MNLKKIDESESEMKVLEVIFPGQKSPLSKYANVMVLGRALDQIGCPIFLNTSRHLRLRLRDQVKKIIPGMQPSDRVECIVPVEITKSVLLEELEKSGLKVEKISLRPKK